MRDFINRRWMDIAAIMFLAAMVLACLFMSCNSLKRLSMVGGGAAGGAAAGTLVAGPPGAIVGAGIGGAAASAYTELDISEDREKRLQDKLGGQPPQPHPSWPSQHPWFTLMGAVSAVWVWLRRAHLADAVTGKEPRWDAILRALGLRTHKTPMGRASPHAPASPPPR